MILLENTKNIKSWEDKHKAFIKKYQIEVSQHIDITPPQSIGKKL